MYKAKTRDSDYIQQLADYIKKNLSKGYTQDALKWALINQGHSRTEVDRALKMANGQLAAQAPKMLEKPVIKVSNESHEEASAQQGFWARVRNWFS